MDPREHCDGDPLIDRSFKNSLTVESKPTQHISIYLHTKIKI